jgi:hypothetical protein
MNDWPSFGIDLSVSGIAILLSLEEEKRTNHVESCEKTIKE